MQAILIIAHKDIDQVIELSKKLRPTFKVIIHFDKKAPVSEAQKQKLQQLGVDYFSTISVHWGSWSIGQVAVELMRRAMQDPEIDYVHLISGQDWPLKPIEEINNFYKENDNIYLRYYKADVKKGRDNALNWQKFYYNYDKIDRHSLFGKVYNRLSTWIQSLLRVNKLKKLGINLEIYTGANWCDLPRDAVEYCLDYFDNHENFRKMLKTGSFSDEFWVQTIICNTPQFKSRLQYDYHRFIKWEHIHNSFPAILDERDYKAIKKSNAMFGRKFESPYSDKLRQLLP
ncbi:MULTISPECIES: beta-1,6-N-acetylglucosaminyltransferase [Limosilactobacillus]|jgi:hypothetical protein|uniref:beta-1,6-N-acetylglucosaminyltransferase n=1 Tax=Limosilactobacillus TaxID=2742598 RepID=UPI0021E07803|nr:MULTISPECIES: beta-1,6-N-acetylglucosaminyltransferase [Limosilactobacillus]MCI2030944.1 glycosyltransferase [Limosilactobacillus sp.]UYD07599.1 glycosyltransferase [Limosilactobacillus vaginalis]